MSLKERQVEIIFFKDISVRRQIQGVPLATEPGISLITLPLMRTFQRNFKRTYTYTNTHEQQPYCVGTLSQMTEISREASQAGNRLAG
jgi:hypothetical protein